MHRATAPTRPHGLRVPRGKHMCPHPAQLVGRGATTGMMGVASQAQDPRGEEQDRHKTSPATSFLPNQHALIL